MGSQTWQNEARFYSMIAAVNSTERYLPRYSCGVVLAKLFKKVKHTLCVQGHDVPTFFTAGGADGVSARGTDALQLAKVFSIGLHCT